MVYAYYRRLSEQNTEKVIQQIYQWAEKHGMQIDEIMWEDFVKPKTPIEKRNLALHLLPKLKDGDVLIVSQLSCLGRSAAELDMFFNNILKSRSIRIVCIPIELDIDFANLKSSDLITLEKIAYAAKLQGFLSHEVTESALLARREGGVKLGAASKKYIEKRKNKTEEEKKLEAQKRGYSRSKKFFENKDVITLIEVLKRVFNEACIGDIYEWNWDLINTKVYNRIKILSLIKKYKEEDPTLFQDWDFTGDILSVRLQLKLNSKISSIRRSCKSQQSNIMYNRHNLHNNQQNDDVVPINVQTTIRKKSNSIDKTKLKEIEEDTEISQDVLSEIYAESDKNVESRTDSSSENSIREIMLTLLSKKYWSHSEVESLCKKYGMTMGAALEQINEYSYSKIDDSIISDDDDGIYVVTEYKEYLI